MPNSTCTLNDAQSSSPGKFILTPKPVYKLTQAHVKVELESLSSQGIDEMEMDRPTCSEQLKITEPTNDNCIKVEVDLQSSECVDEMEMNRLTCSEHLTITEATNDECIAVEVEVQSSECIQEIVCWDEYKSTESRYAEEIFMVDDVEGEVLIDGCGESDGAESNEDEMIEQAPTPDKKNISKKRRRRRKDTDEETPYEGHHYTAKSKRKNGRKSSHPSVLSKQNRICNENIIYECEICQRTFANKNFLDRHFMTHTGEKPYECEICEQRFNQKQNLDRHFLTHTGQKPFSCRICKAEFNQRANLNRHILTHTGEQPFKCNVCNVTFNQKANLNRHLLAHTGEKPFKCHLCDAKFTQKGNLTKHVKRHTDEEGDLKSGNLFGRKIKSDTPFYLLYVGESDSD